MACAVPVALILFNRPKLTARVFEVIRQVQPRRLFLIADGPRHASESGRCAETRKLVQNVDWPCEVRTNFSETNLGCGRRPATGIDWIFTQVEEAIILEDDCLPSQSFFRFCAELLAHFRDDSRVMHISGNNFQSEPCGQPYSYYFSKYTHSWGWATWRRAWQRYDFTLSSWPQFKASGQLRSIFPDPAEARYWTRKLDSLHRRQRDDAWDYQWNYALWAHRGLSVLPTVNLVQNLGFGPQATHTREPLACAQKPPQEIGPLLHPPNLAVMPEADTSDFRERFHPPPTRWKRMFSLALARMSLLLK